LQGAAVGAPMLGSADLVAPAKGGSEGELGGLFMLGECWGRVGGAFKLIFLAGPIGAGGGYGMGGGGDGGPW